MNFSQPNPIHAEIDDLLRDKSTYELGVKFAALGAGLAQLSDEIGLPQSRRVIAAMRERVRHAGCRTADDLLNLVESFEPEETTGLYHLTQADINTLRSVLRRMKGAE